MSILTSTTTVISEEEKLQRITKNIKSISARAYGDLVRVQKTGIDAVWNNKDFTPQQIIDALGDDAIKIFEVHGKLTDYLTAISIIDEIPYTPALPTYAFTVSGNKITVTDKPYQ